MAIRIAINGFGRIGRNVLRSAWHRDDVTFVHINDLTSNDMLAYLLKHDTVHRTWGPDVKAVEGGISIDGKLIPTTAERDPTKLPWRGVDVVFECTGVFTKRAQAAHHLTAGARKVIISAPADDADATFVFGVNHQEYDASTHHIVSNASCTTNCLAPAAKPIHDAIGIVSGLVTTVHSYTMDQNLLDAPHRDFRRSRAAAMNMVPTSTGAAKAIGLVIPSLKGKLDGMAIRVPTPNVSLVDFVFNAARPTSVDEVNDLLRKAAASGPLHGVLEATDELLVSSDFLGNPHSSIADLASTKVLGGTLVKMLAWYDNEWGFSCRMTDLALVVAG